MIQNPARKECVFLCEKFSSPSPHRVVGGLGEGRVEYENHKNVTCDHACPRARECDDIT
jgi:hypothetical protein